MSSATTENKPVISLKILKHSAWDSLPVACGLAYGLVLALFPSLLTVAIGTWWGSNSIAHLFIHKPFFRSRSLNVLFRWFLTLLLGIPQTLWRERHLAHHAEAQWKLCFSWPLAIDVLIVAVLWGTLLLIVPDFFLWAYVPGYLIGLTLCALQGHYEHVRGITSHYGLLYNLLFFNDGYHVEHHHRPGAHWSEIPALYQPEARNSRWPAVLRWLDCFSLESLERFVLHPSWLQRFVVRCHRRAFRQLLPQIQHSKRVGIVGGGLFPRTALILRDLLPEAELVIIDFSQENLRIASSLLSNDVTLLHVRYNPQEHKDFDVVVIPLAYVGDRKVLYQSPTVPLMVIHDWLWNRHTTGSLVSFFLLKRLNLVKKCVH